MKFLLIAFTLLVGCRPARDSSAYLTELEACLLKPTCEEYVACRADVSWRYGRPFEGSCSQVGK